MMKGDDQGGGPLAGIRVVDLTDALGAYAGRLLADLGADVLRVEVPGQQHLRLPPFHYPSGGPPVSLFERFVNAGKRSIELDLRRAEGQRLLERLLDEADVALEGSSLVLEHHGWSTETLAERYPRLVRVVTTAHGLCDVEAEVPADDLVLLAEGGLLHLGGYVDAGPVVPYGFQSGYMASIYAAVGALAGLLSRDGADRGVTVDVSAQECVAQALETSAVGYVLTGRVASSRGESALEAGTGIYPCADGYVSVVAGRLGTSAAWQSLTAWIRESDSNGSAELADERWTSFEFRQQPSSIARFEELFAVFAANRTRAQLYKEAQERGIALSPVNDFGALFDDAQLTAREFFVEVPDPLVGATLRYPSAPYRLTATPVRPPRPAPVAGAHTVSVMTEQLEMQDGQLENLVSRGIV